MAFSPAACVLLHTLRDEPAPRMSPQLHKREKKDQKKEKSSSDALQMLLPVSGSTYPTCHSLPPSLSLSLSLALVQDRACRWHCFQLGRQLASVPLTKGYSHRLLGSESNHTSLTNHRASSSWCNHSHTDTVAHTNSHTPQTRTHIDRRTYTDVQSYARTALTFLSPFCIASVSFHSRNENSSFLAARLFPLKWRGR